MLAAELREGFEAFDFGIPFILQEADELRAHDGLDVSTLPAFTAMNVEQLTGLLGKGDTFISQDLQSATLFGDYRVDGAVMNVGGYNDYLSRLTRRISQALSEPMPKGNKIATHLAKPYLQVNTAELTGWLDDYIWTRFVWHHLQPAGGRKLARVAAATGGGPHHQGVCGGPAGIRAKAHHRPDRSAPAHAERGAQAHAAREPLGGSEQVHLHPLGLACAQWRAGARLHPLGARRDTQVQAFCKISENRHTFARLRYVKEDGLPAFYSPDFLVRTADAVYLAETKAQQQTAHPNVQRKLKAALAWCERINALTPEQRGGPPWHYVLLAENVVYEWQAKGARLAELLDYARLRPLANASLQTSLI